MAEYDPMAGFRLNNGWEGLTDNTKSVMGNPMGLMDLGYTSPLLNPSIASGAISPASLDWSKVLFGGKDAAGNVTNGALGAGLGMLNGLMNFGQARKASKHGAAQLDEAKRQFNASYGASKLAYNNDIDSTNQARNAAQPGAYKQLERMA